MSKTAVIFGITGQAGSYLTEYLLGLGYHVYGMVRRNSVAEHQQNRLEHIDQHDRLTLQYGDLSDVSSIESLIRNAQPDEVYNLAAQSHVRISYDIPQYTVATNVTGTMNILEAVRTLCPTAHYYQASSSEMFGNSVNPDGRQSETTPMHPVSPYGCSKLFGYSITRNYRHAHKLFAANGILFNNESPRRGSNFVTTKIVKNAVLIAKGKLHYLELGNLDAQRDWGHTRDYVKAMHAILNHTVPDDFVIATGITHSVREFCDRTFTILGLDYNNFVRQNPKFMRPEELKYLCGNADKAKTTLGWHPDTSFDALINEMVEHWMAHT